MGLINAWRGLISSNDDLNKRRNRLKRMYSGAKFDRTNLSWVTPLSSPDQSYKNSINTLRKRVHDLVRNNNYAAQAIRYATNQIVGQGVTMQAQIKSQRGGTPNTRINESIESEWSRWGRKDSCDIRGVLCFSELERLAVRSMIESGECFIVIHRKAFGRSKIPFSLEVLEAEQLDEDYKGATKNNKNVWRLGIELSPEGRAVSYAFLKKHPGDTNFATIPEENRHIIVAAKDVVHLFLPLRPGQHRGVPFLASAINHLHQLDGYIEATVVGQRASSALMGFITSPEGELDVGGEVFDYERVSGFEPGTFKYLAPGESISVPDLDKANGEFEPFVRSMLRSMASGLGCSFEAISSDYSQSNYSSSRLAMLQDRDNWRTIQKMLKESFYQPLFEQWLEMAVLSGTLSLPTYSTTPEVYEKVRWVCRGYSYIDPQKEIAAQRDAIRSGLKTLSECIAENGGDVEEMLIARQAELAKLDELNIITDSDPSAVNKSGGSQFKPINTVDPFGDTQPPTGEDAENVADGKDGSY
jgi:lambda family phage portal protein